MRQSTIDWGAFRNSLARHRESVLGLLLVLLALLAFANSFPGAFITDDITIVARNPLVNSLDLRAIFTTDYWGGDAKQAVLFRPLTILSFALNQRLLGPEAWAFHLVNVILHGVVSLVLFCLLRRWGIWPWSAFFAAALFAVHPMHGEVVNVMVGRSELLAALFFLLALYFAAAEEPRSLAAVFVLFGLAILSKESAITFLPALLLSDQYFRRGLKQRLPLYGGLLILTGGWLLYRKFGLVNGLRVPTEFSSEDAAIFQPLQLLSAPARVLTALKIQVIYLWKLLVPIKLQTIYSPQSVAAPVASLFSTWGVIICLVTGLLASLSVYGWRQRRLFGLAIPLYAASCVVTANIFFVSGVVMAERSAYLPSVWFCLTLVVLLPVPNFGKDVLQRGCFVLFTLLLLFMFTATLVRNRDFRDSVSLWSSGLERDRNNVIAGIFLIDAYTQKYENDKAIEIGEQILSNHPDSRRLLEIQARMLMDVGRSDEALLYLERAIRLMGNASTFELLTTVVAINAKLGRPVEALKWLDRIDPKSRDENYWKYRGNAYAELGDYAQALVCYRQIGDSPQAPEVKLLIDKLLMKMGKSTE